MVDNTNHPSLFVAVGAAGCRAVDEIYKGLTHELNLNPDTSEETPGINHYFYKAENEWRPRAVLLDTDPLLV